MIYNEKTMKDYSLIQIDDIITAEDLAAAGELERAFEFLLGLAKNGLGEEYVSDDAIVRLLMRCSLSPDPEEIEFNQ